MKIIKYLIMVLIIFISCEKNRSHFSTYNVNIKECNLVVHSILNEGNNLYFLGYCEKEELIDREAVIYKSSIDKFEKSKKIVLGKGAIKNAVINDNFIYFFKEVFTENSFSNIETYLCKYDIINDITLTLLKIKGVPIKIFFKSDKEGFIIVRFQGKNILKHTEDGKTWSKDLIIRDVGNNLFSTNKVSFSRENTNVGGDVVNSWTYSGLLFNLHNNTEFNIKLDEFCVDNDKSVWGIAKESNTINVYKRTDKSLSKVYEFKVTDSFFSKTIYRYNNFIGVLLGEVNSVGTTNHLYLSYDEGKTFKEEKLPISNYVKPIYFYKDEKIIIYSGVGRISVCDLKKQI